MQVVNQNEFKELLSKPGLLVADFFATWCGPCKMLGPVLEELDGELEQVTFVKIDIDADRELADELQLVSVPTLMFFKDGEKYDELIGFKPKQQILEKLEGVL